MSKIWTHRNRAHVWRALFVACCASVLCLLQACSTKKNTAGTRFYHATTARFNTLYNGTVAFEEGEEAQNRSHKDDYNRLLPMYISTSEATANAGRSNYETAIEKCEKAIKVHSIKKRPITKNNNHRRTEREKAFLARKEFNPYLYKAWLMMADAQFRKGEFFEAASTYNYILRLYQTQPDVVCMARARLARCYVALEWAYDAEDLLNKMGRDSITRRGTQERNNTMAAYLILTNQYEAALPYLQSTIKNTKKKMPRARLHFLKAQLLHQLDRNEEAYTELSRVTRAHPPYEMAFNARIMQTEVMPSSKYAQMLKRLKSMARSEKNKDYLDRVYYAIGNIHMARRDTSACLAAWEKGVEKGTRNGSDKAALLLHLGKLYWEMEKYIEAAEAYKKCVSILNKNHEEYKESQRREKILSELSPHLSTIKLQDSLQALAVLPEAEYLAAIDRVIAELKKKEKEQAKLADKQATASRTNTTAGAGNMGQQGAAGNNASLAANSPKNWYFYNPSAVQKGVQEFQRRWGQRPNEDYWRISNKRSLPQLGGGDATQDEEAYDEAAADSLYGVGGGDAGGEEREYDDSLANDPHHREYYLKQIPFSQEQMEQSNALLSEALYNAGLLEQDRLENWALAERTLRRLLNDFPDYEDREQAYYHLFLLYGRMGRDEDADGYRQRILEEFPEGKLATLLSNPYYDQIARNGKHMEDSLYAAAYEAYQQNDYTQVEKNYLFNRENFPDGRNSARMMFIRAMSNLYGGSRDTFLTTLKEVIQKYPREEVTEIANAIMKGIDEGRILQDERYDASSIWGRRARRSDSDSTAQDTLSDLRLAPFNFLLAYPTGSLDENQLLFEMARYNFSNYMVRNFDIELREDRGLSMLLIRGFLSFDEVHSYVQKLYTDEYMNRRLEGIRSLLISDDNLKLLGSLYSFDDYKEFYDLHFAPLEVPEELQIDEPTDLQIISPDDYDPAEAGTEEDEEQTADDDDDFFDNF